VLSDVTHDMGEAAALEKDGVERDLQLLLAADPGSIEPGLRLVKREWPTDVGPPTLFATFGIQSRKAGPFASRSTSSR
jgi:RecB family endonuclease NucS